MNKCPNCGQETARTEDWACQHCGFPLPYGPFRKVAKTYKDVLEEKRRESRSPAMEPKEESPRVSPPLPPAFSPEPKPPPPPPPSYNKVIPVPEPPVAPAKEPELELPPPPAPVARVSAPAEPEPPPAPKVVLEPTTDNLDVEKLFAILSQNYAAALEKYQDNVLKVKGLVYRTVISDAIDINYLLLTTEKDFGQKQVSCTFSKKYEEALAKLASGGKVTVEGKMRVKYDGTRFNILMKDCILVQ